MSPQFNGLLLVHKPSGCTSHDLVARARKILGTKSVGHSGTLDPLANGLMVLLINEGTKLSQYILEGNKGYRVKMRFGLRTDTLDITGQVVEEKPIQVDPEKIEQEAMTLVGDFKWPVPIYSAVKVQGKKLYEYARSDQVIESPVKDMKFWDMQKHHVTESEAEFSLKCSKGSYIRTWVDQLGQILGCGATMTELQRHWSDPYELAQACTLEEVEAQIASNQLGTCFVPMEKALPQVKIIRVRGQDQTLLGNGQISHDLRTQLIQKFQPEKDQYIQVFSSQNQLMAIIGLEANKGFQIKRIFRY